MVKENFKHNYTEVETMYDEMKYDILNTGDFVTIIRKKDNAHLEFYAAQIIIQCNTNEGIDRFIVYENKRGYSVIEKVKVYDCLEKEIVLKKEFTSGISWTSTMEEIQLTPNSFIVSIDTCPHHKQIYNAFSNEESPAYDEIYNYEKVKKVYGDPNMILVSRTYRGRELVLDTISFGINPETFKITTLIWSDLQQRHIKVYTNKERKELKRKREKRNCYYRGSDKMDIDEFTICYEVEEYAYRLLDYLEEPEGIYKKEGYCGLDKSVNEDFIQKLVKAKKVKSNT